MSSPQEVVFFGTAGHALSFAESAQRRLPQALCKVVAYIDDFRGADDSAPDAPAVSFEALPDAPIVSFETWRRSLRDVPVFLAVGDPHARRVLAERVSEAGGRFASFYRDEAPFAPAVRVGEGTAITALVTVGPSTVIGRHVHVMALASIDARCRIGDYVTICPMATIYGRVVVEDGVFVGVGARIVNESERPLVVGTGATIGAGAVVTGPVAPGSRLMGNPAREMRELAVARRSGAAR